LITASPSRARDARSLAQSRPEFCRDRTELSSQKQRLTIVAIRTKNSVAKNAIRAIHDRKEASQADTPKVRPLIRVRRQSATSRNNVDFANSTRFYDCMIGRSRAEDSSLS
jgi:hypothetical protein